MFKRGSGILLHISSIPGGYGIGDFGKSAYSFVDFLADAKQSYWQILPLNPTDLISSNSPYSSNSAFAGNPLFIDCGEANTQENLNVVDYKKVIANKMPMVKKISNFNYEQDEEFIYFVKKEKYWLFDYALFMTLKDFHDGKMWAEWSDEYKYRDRSALNKFAEANKDQILIYSAEQFIFFKQWFALKQYANDKGIQIIGDIPIYVQFDSVDVWTHQNNFKLDAQAKPTVVAGVPPDDFSATGQWWGNPIYNWDVMKSDNFDWWMKRLAHNLRMFDIVRIDHFRGLINYWEIPALEKDATKGEWNDVPAEFFDELNKLFPKAPIIAEDLGMISAEVIDKIRAKGFPGMKILQFAFNSELKQHPYLPHNYDEDCLVYTGTHDNNTVKGWWDNEASDHEKNNVRTYLNDHNVNNDVHLYLTQLAMKSKAQIAIIPLQDILGLGQESRTNKPATTVGNWKWRSSPEMLNSCVSSRLASLAQSTSR